MTRIQALKKLADRIRKFGEIHVPGVGDLTVKDLIEIKKKKGGAK